MGASGGPDLHLLEDKRITYKEFADGIYWHVEQDGGTATDVEIDHYSAFMCIDELKVVVQTSVLHRSEYDRETSSSRLSWRRAGSPTYTIRDYKGFDMGMLPDIYLPAEVR